MINALSSACNLISRQSERTIGLEREVHNLRQDLNSASDLISRQTERTVGLEQEVHNLRREDDSASDLVSRQAERTTGLEQEVHKLWREISNFKMDVIRPAGDNLEPGLPNSFQFALQDRFRGSETETTGKLQIYLESLESLLPAFPRAQWLDIGCGRGEWLEAVSKLGYSILGLDSNPVSVLRCRDKRLNAEERDALAYLRSLDDGSVAVVTAFHVVEHWPMHYVLALVQETVRVLKPGGLLIVETPNPAKLLTGTAHFWNDPTHYHPIPLKLLEFVYEYYELSVVKRLS